MDRTFANRLADLRKNTGQSQKDAAAALGVSQALLSHYENGIRECGLGFVTRAAAYYNVTCDCLLGVSSLRYGFSEGAVSSEDIPEDNQLSSLTVFRVLTVLREKLEHQPPLYRDMLLNYFAAVTYRVLVLAVNAGDLPRKWVGERMPIENPVFLECLSGLEKNLLNGVEKGPQGVPDSETPLCVETLVREMETHVTTQLEGLFKDLGE